MRRRTRRGPNNSESTGKIGQELPANQQAPLRPAYPDAERQEESTAKTVEPSTTQGEDDSARAKGEPGTRGRRRRGGRGRRRTGTVSQAAPEAGGTDVALSGDARDDLDDLPEELDDVEGAGEEAAPELPAKGKLVVETQPESPSVPPPAPEATASGPRQPRGFVVLTIGLPGSGKTTWFKRRSVTPLSSDMLRGILFDDITEQRYQGLVFSTLRSLLRARLIAKMPWNYVDATNLSPHERRQWIKMARSFGYEVQAVFFDVPFEVCMERNRKRERTVSEEIMEKMAERLRPPSFREGFSKITVVRVKGVPGSMPPGSLNAAESAADGDGDEDTGAE
jgi:predicted kinase